MSTSPRSDTAGAVGTIVDALGRTVDEIVAKTASITNRGRDIDDHQVKSERVAYLATELTAARCLKRYAETDGAGDPRRPRHGAARGDDGRRRAERAGDEDRDRGDGVPRSRDCARSVETSGRRPRVG